jgi:hypothetical protein
MILGLLTLKIILILWNAFIDGFITNLLCVFLSKNSIL